MARANLVVLAALIACAAPLAAQTPVLAPARQTVTLADALRLAQQFQPTVLAAEGQVRAAEARTRAAKGAFLPNLSFSSGGSRSSSEGTSRIDPITGDLISGNQTNQSVQFGVQTGITLFDGFNRSNQLRAARATEAALEANFIDVRFTTALSTTNTFLDALEARQLLSVRQAGVSRAEEQAKVANARLQTGSATRSDSLRSLVTLGTAQLAMLNAQTQLATTEANLGRLIGSNDRVAATEDSSLYNLPATLDTAAIRQDVINRSPRVRNAEAQAEAARASYRASRANYWPTLTASANTSISGSQANDYDLRQNRSIGLNLSWNLFDRFSRNLTVAQSAIALDNAVAQSEDASRQIIATLTQQLATLQTAQTRIAITTISVQAAREDLRVINERYRLGVATIVDVLTSQEALNSAEVEVITARLAVLRARVQIETLVGRNL